MGPIFYGAVAVGGFALYRAVSGSPLSYPAGNVGAFLAMIRQFESRGNYRAYVYGGTFGDMSGHPIETGEKDYVYRPDTGEPTSAAGAYQIVYTTWRRVATALALSAFSAENQDAVAVYLIKESGAYDDVVNGRVSYAIRRLSGVWESLAVRSESTLVASYLANGGKLA
jgi:lysozyme